VCGYLSHYSVWVWAGRRGDRSSIPGRGEMIFPLASVSRPALGPTQSPVQWVPGVLTPGLKRDRVVTLTTRPHLVPSSRMSRGYTSSSPSAFMACIGTALPFYFNIILPSRLSVSGIWTKISNTFLMYPLHTTRCQSCPA
jgi:hypothetical protein